jgi:hypothetical protein
MRRSSYPNSEWYKQPESAYARTDAWATRYYTRKIDGAAINYFAGLNTSKDDYSKKTGETPYSMNARLYGSDEKRSRAQLMSRYGNTFYMLPSGAETTDTTDKLADSNMDLVVRENRSIRHKITFSNRITKLGLWLKRDKVSESNSIFVIILRDNEKEELCRAAISLNNLSDKYEYKEFRFSVTTVDTAYIELTLYDDLDDRSRPNNDEVYIASAATANHEAADYEMPNLDKSLREVPYQWVEYIGIPLVRATTTNWRTFPVWLQDGYFNAGNGNRYVVIGAVNGSGMKVIYQVKYATVLADESIQVLLPENSECKVLIASNYIDQRSDVVRMTQAGDKLYFVDGWSELQCVDLVTGTVRDAKPDPNDVDIFDFIPNHNYITGDVILHNDGSGKTFWTAKNDFTSDIAFDAKDWDKDTLESLRAWKGASLIYFLNNRLFLAGFNNVEIGANPRLEPNLVIMSSITSVKPVYEMFNRQVDFWYTPDLSQDRSSATPITAFSSVQDQLIVANNGSFSLFNVQASVAAGGVAQATPEGAGYGVARQEHITKSRNNLYFYNMNDGVVRFGGSTTTVISAPIDVDLKRIKNTSKVFMQLHKDKLRMFYGYDGENTNTFYDYVAYATHKSYWYRDSNTPFSYGFSDNAINQEFAVRSDYPALISLDGGVYRDTDQSEKRLADMDCIIPFEYDIKYITSPDRLDEMILRRIHITSLQNFNSSIFIGLDYDYNNNTVVWRKFINGLVQQPDNPTDIFRSQGEVGGKMVSIRVLTNGTKFIQIRLKQYCFNYQAEIMQVSMEYGTDSTL